MLTLLESTPVYAAARTASVSGNWNSTATWGGLSVPVAGDTVVINAGITVTVTAPAACDSINILAANTVNGITISGTNSLTVSGAITTTVPGNNNRHTTIAVGAGALSAGSIALAGAGAASRYTELTISTGTVTVSGSITSAGTSSRIIFTDAGTINIGGTFMSGTLGTFTASNGTVNYTGTNANLNSFAYTYYNLTFSGTGTSTASATVTIRGNLANIGTGTLGFGTRAVTLSGTATQSIAGFTTTGTVSMTKPGGTATFTGNVAGNGLTINGVGGTLNLGTGLTHTFTGTWTRTAGTLDGDSSTLKIGGSRSGTGGTFTASTGTVEWYAAGIQTVAGVTYNNLTLSGTSAKTTTGVTVNGILSMEGTATASATPTYGPAATLQYNRVGPAQATGNEWPATFTATGGIIITNTGEIRLNAAKVLGAGVPLTINNGATLNTSSSNYAVTFGGNFVNNGGTFTAGSSPITIANTSATQTIAGFTTTGTVSMTKTSGTATFDGNVNGGALTISGAYPGTLHLGEDLTHTFTGNWAITNTGILDGGRSKLRIGGSSSSTTYGYFYKGSSTVEYYASGNQVILNDYYWNLTLSGSGTKTIGSSPYAPWISGILSMEGTATISAAPVYDDAATLQYNRATALTTGVEWITPFTATGGVLIANTGTITLNAAKAINAPLTINSGAKLNLDTFTTSTANSLTLGGVNKASGSWGSTGSTATHKDDTYFAVTAGILNVANGPTATVTLGNLTQTYDGSPKAATATTDPSGLTVGFTYNSSPTAPTAAGTYAVVGTINDENYSGTASGTLEISKATPVITWGNPDDIYYGTALSSTQLCATASVAGTSFVYTPAAGTVMSAGLGQTLHVVFTPTDTTNYSTASKDVYINVLQYTIEIDAPTDISDWQLNIGTNSKLTQTMNVRATGSAAWTVTAKDNNASTAGHMTLWDGFAYKTANLFNAMRVHGPTLPNVTLPGGGTIATGSCNTPNINVTFIQEVGWTDAPTEAPDTYQIVVTFTATLD